MKNNAEPRACGPRGRGREHVVSSLSSCLRPRAPPVHPGEKPRLTGSPGITAQLWRSRHRWPPVVARLLPPLPPRPSPFGGEGVFRGEGRAELCHPPRSNASPSSPRCKQSQRLALGGPQLPGPGDGRIFGDVDNGCFVRSGACVGNAALGLTQETRLLFQARVDSAGTLGPSPLPELAEPLPTFPGPAAWESQDWDSAFRSPRDANGINGVRLEDALNFLAQSGLEHRD